MNRRDVRNRIKKKRTRPTSIQIHRAFNRFKQLACNAIRIPVDYEGWAKKILKVVPMG
jgi:hypothetical protein